MTGVIAAPLDGTKVTDDYVRSLGRIAYLWGWPLVNMHNRLSLMAGLTEPALLGGVVPAGPPGSIGMLHDYIRPEERIVACPNQDVAYGFGVLDAQLGPAVIQVPDFGDRFWVYQVVDQRTDSFVELGAMYGTEPGLYLLAPSTWDGKVPDEIRRVFHFDTRVGVVIPRVFLDDTPEDRSAVLPLVNQIGMYPLTEFTGSPRTYDWTSIPTVGGGSSTSGQQETQWVDPTRFFDVLPDVLAEVPARPGEEAMYAWITSLLTAAAADDHVADVLRESAVDSNTTLVGELFQFRNIGLPSAHHWTTQRNGAGFGGDYLSRTAMAKANIFVNTPRETAYFYQDLDADGRRLNGGHRYSITFPAGQLPPLQGFWSLTLYNEHHFFHANDLDRFSLGTKNKDLHYEADGSLTLIASAEPQTGPATHSNWLPAPVGDFSLYLRAYWPDAPVLDGTWTPPPVLQTA
ncbi:DUF1214 domain-containing protein [Kribbella sp. CA-245084]|uniref:DUF1214 domain-containing protein n=1 Tax=Kribbella sp. CA-245084 TaxID=3239940 RepID=UPI003D8AECE3